MFESPKIITAAKYIGFDYHLDITAAECSRDLWILLLLNILCSTIMWILLLLNVRESYGCYCF